MVRGANLERRCRRQNDDSGRNHTHHPVFGASDAARRRAEDAIGTGPRLMKWVDLFSPANCQGLPAAKVCTWQTGRCASFRGRPTGRSADSSPSRLAIWFLSDPSSAACSANLGPRGALWAPRSSTSPRRHVESAEGGCVPKRSLGTRIMPGEDGQPGQHGHSVAERRVTLANPSTTCGGPIFSVGLDTACGPCRGRGETAVRPLILPGQAQSPFPAASRRSKTRPLRHKRRRGHRDSHLRSSQPIHMLSSHHRRPFFRLDNLHRGRLLQPKLGWPMTNDPSD